MANDTRQCSIGECERPRKARGWCSVHYGRWVRHGDPHTKRKVRQPCSVENCTNLHAAKGLCMTHYSRVRRTGEIGQAEVQVRNHGAICSFTECEKPVTARRLCRTHYSRLQRSGDVTKGAFKKVVGYNAAHYRVVRAKGRAAIHTCCRCTKGAEHRAYDHQDPSQMIGTGGPYSLKPEHYWPMCRSCHKRFDNARSQDRQWLTAAA